MACLLRLTSPSEHQQKTGKALENLLLQQRKTFSGTGHVVAIVCGDGGVPVCVWSACQGISMEPS